MNEPTPFYHLFGTPIPLFGKCVNKRCKGNLFRISFARVVVCDKCHEEWEVVE